MNASNQAAIAAIDNITDGLERVMAGFANLKSLLSPEEEVQEIDPRDPANKLPDGKFTERGVEVCYRLFDAGNTRYSVRQQMQISYSAATHRLEAWKKAGGVNRIKLPLE
ncbi:MULTISPECIES: hypothetical protein [Pseudomonas]|uniref:hypothetical protein n=1 Tax=Pseudomonas TaxID=286 RepID=UPI00069D84ED|nr:MULTISPECIES: hypothetical protein [Pseudomonas]RTY75806.1 hypothetical protein EKA83_15105 [Pseudomonas veronii]